MSALLFLLLAQVPGPQQALPQPTHSGAPVQADADAQPSEPEVAPYEGEVVEGLAELRRLSSDGDDEEALELGERLLVAPSLAQLDEPARARVHFDIGVARARAGRTVGAMDVFHAAAALAGPGALRADASYDAGTAMLERAEVLRVEIPEIAERLGLPAPASAPPPPPVAGPAGGDAAPDPLDMAEAAYRVARGELLERLRLDARDEDTRANLELCTRRLRELLELREQREQEEQEQQDDSTDPDEESEEQPEDSEGEPPEEPQDPQDQDQESESERSEDESQEEQPPEPEPEDADGEEQEPEEQPQPEPDEETPPEEGEDPESEPEPAREEERVLSREEVMRLLDQLDEIEEQARAVRAMLRDRRRKPVEKDW